MMDVIEKTPDDFSVLVGDDALILPFMAAGGDGVISVLSNALPQQVSHCVQSALNNDFSTTKESFYQLRQYMSTCFIESNPVPIKAIMSELGFGIPDVRLPLTQASEANMQEILKVASSIKNIRNN